jgi:hypothetical protein
MPIRDTVTSLRQIHNGERFYSGRPRQVPVGAEIVLKYGFLIRFVSVQRPGSLLSQTAILDVIEGEIADHVRLVTIFVGELQAVSLSHSVPVDVRKIANVDVVEVDQDIRVRGSDAFVTIGCRRVSGPEPGVWSGVSIPGPNEDVVLPVAFQINFHLLDHQQSPDIRDAIRNIHREIVGDRVRDRRPRQRHGVGVHKDIHQSQNALGRPKEREKTNQVTMQRCED